MSTNQLRQALRDVDFPAGKDELIRARRRPERRTR